MYMIIFIYIYDICVLSQTIHKTTTNYPSGSSDREGPEIQDLPHLATRGPSVEALLPKPQREKLIACRELTYPV